MTRAARFIAVAAMMIVVAAPVARLLCAYQCRVAVAPESSLAPDEHCHQTQATTDTTLSASALPDCSPFATSDAATRERNGAPLGSAPLAPPYLQLLDLQTDRFGPRIVLPSVCARGTPLSPGAHAPLRI